VHDNQYKHIMTTQTIETLLQQIADKLPASEQHLVTALYAEIEQLTKEKKASSASALAPSKDEASGCYRIANDPAYYCPNCYDRKQQRVPTQRLNKKLRVCPQCRASIRPID
jgi:Zn finger protein HypA/HybF involved in hydrogenase expression